MKSIYSAIILLVTMSIFSLAASAQDRNGAHNNTSSATANSIRIDTTNGSSSADPSGTLTGSVSKARKAAKTGKKASSEAGLNAPAQVGTQKNANAADQDQTNELNGSPGSQGREYDRYGYQGTPLSNGTRPCLVAGARRCVQ